MHRPKNTSKVKAMKFCSHVGMNYTNNFADLFSFQLIGPDGVAYAGVDFENGLVERIYYIPQLNNRKLAIIRLAKMHYNKARK